jgi:glutamine synthetase
MKLALCLSFATTAAAFAPAFRPTTTTTTVSSSALAAGGGAVLNRVTGQSQLDPAVIQRYMDLPMPADTVLAEYVWVDADGACRSKTRTLPSAKVRQWPREQ